MGAILAIEKDGIVYIGADAVKSCGSVNYYVNNVSNLRLHRMPSGVIVATCGAMALTQRLWINDSWFETEEGEAFDKRFIVTKVIPRFYDAIKHIDAAWEEDKDSSVKTTNTCFIIAKGSDIYTVSNDLHVTRCRKIAAISDEKADSMMLTYAQESTDPDPERIIKGAFELAARNYGAVYDHGYVINTGDLTLKKMEDIT